MTGKLAWFEIHVSDTEKAAEFYRALFGWTFSPLGDADDSLHDYLVITTASGEPAGGGLARSGSPNDVGRESSVLYLFTEDIDAAVGRALAAGGAVHRPRMNIGGSHGYCAIVRDPDGNHVGLWSDR